jgi:rare lipoprotein A
LLRQVRSALGLSALLVLAACAPLAPVAPSTQGPAAAGGNAACGPEGGGGPGCPPAAPDVASVPGRPPRGPVAPPVPAAETAPVQTPFESPPAVPTEPPRESDQQGLASWYGPGLHGRRTASGERFDRYELTAAHRTLPFGTRVCVRSGVTGKTVVVRINDRGPFSGGRVIDLSQAAAQELGMTGLGIKPVELWLLGRGEEVCPNALQDAPALTETQRDAAEVAAPGTGARRPAAGRPNATPRSGKGRARNARN